jgi:polysaccharide biosynthesis/export protein
LRPKSHVLTYCMALWLGFFWSLPMICFGQQIGSDIAMDGVLVPLGPGDGVQLTVYGQSDMSGALTVSEDGRLSVPLVGPVSVGGLSAADAARSVENALRSNKILVEPHVTITLTQARSQRVSLLGEVARPGRFAMQTDSTILELIAQAGGITANGGNVVFRLRTQADGSIQRVEIPIAGLANNQAALVAERPKAGDTYVIPKADQFYIYGQVTAPNMYRIEPGMTLIQAIARAGGVTVRGSEKRVEIKRTMPDGKVKAFNAKPFEPVLANDVIRVKESLF